MAEYWHRARPDTSSVDITPHRDHTFEIEQRETTTMSKRCTWCGTDPLYMAYHDQEWGVPVWDDQTLFEFLILEGAQAGLSWITILRKRDGYRALFDGFDANKIARYRDTKLDKLLLNPCYCPQPTQSIRSAQERPGVFGRTGRKR